MKKSPPGSVASSRAISSSLRPSGVPDIDLPFGVPPAALQRIQPRGGKLTKSLHRRIRALAHNANKVRRRYPLTAALCWHESGRLLHLHAGRLSEAWICYSRAVAIYPDYKPSISQLRRLARAADESEVVEQLVNAELDRASSPVEKSALLSELAAAQIRSGDLVSARIHLEAAIALHPEALVPRILLVTIAASLGEVVKEMPALSALADKWDDSSIGNGFRLLLARMEEKQGQLEAALDRLTKMERDPALREPIDWARLRLCLRLDKTEEVVAIVETLRNRMSDPALAKALSRFQAALLYFRVRPGQTLAADLLGSLEGDDFTRLIASLGRSDSKGAARGAADLRRQSQTAELKEALSISKMEDEWRPGVRPELFFGDIDTSSAACRATISFLKMGTQKEERVPEIPAAALCRALEAEDWDRVVQVLRTLREQTLDGDARWPLLVTESAIHLEHLDRSTKVLDELVEASGRLSRKPLPTILRAFEKRHRRLADIAMSETGDSENKRFVALRLAWAAHHLESSDPFESARLYTESLDTFSGLLFSISGLERTSGTAGKELAGLYLMAAEHADDKAVRVRAMLKAGLLYLSLGLREEATPLFGEAAELLREDEMLTRLAYQLSVTYPEAARGEFVDAVLKEKVPDLLGAVYLGSLGLRFNPAAAADWFEKALEETADDTVARRGNIEALIQAGRVSILSDKLLADLRNADGVKQKAAIYLRIAHVDRYYRNDDASAVLSLLALDELLPGHRPTLVRLAVYLLTKKRTEEIGRVLVSLSQTVTDDADAIALTRVSALSDSSEDRLALLSHIARQGRATILELTSLEGVCESEKERLTLLEQIVESLPESQVYVSRLADAAGRLNDYERAVTLYKQSLDGKICVVYNLFAMADRLREWQNYPLLLDTLVIAADYWRIPEHKVDALLEAAILARETLGDEQRAAELALRALSVDPARTEAFSMGQDVLTTSVDDASLLLKLVETRLEATDNLLEQYELHLKARDILSGFGDELSRAQALEHLEAAIGIVRAGVVADTERLEKELDETGSVAVEEDALDFDEQIAALTHDARFPHDDAIDAPLFVELGLIYALRSETEEVARQYFENALALDGSNVDALEHLADIHLNNGDLLEAAKLLEDLVALMEASESKTEKLLLYARVLEETSADEKVIEKVLLEAQKLAPLALEPLERLADLYARQGDDPALGVHLTSALASHSQALVSRPDDVGLYRNLERIALRKGEELLGAMAADLGTLVSEDEAHEPLAKWRFGPKVGTVKDDEHLYPSGVTNGFRHAMAILEQPLLGALGFVFEDLEKTGNTKLKKRDVLSQVTLKIARSFGVKEVLCYVSPNPMLRILPGESPAVVFPQTVQGASLEVRRFASATALQMLRSGFGLVGWISVERIRRLLYGAMRLLDEELEVEGLADEQVEIAAKEVEAAVPSDVLGTLKPSLDSLREALDRRDLADLVFNVGYRSGFLASGSVVGAIAGLRALTGVAEGPLSEIPGIGLLVSFVFSRDNLELVKLLSAK